MIRSTRWCLALLVAVIPAAPVSGQTVVPPDSLFRAGQFDQAAAGYRERQRSNPRDAAAAAMLGRIALLRNDLKEAERQLRRAVELAPDDQDAKRVLAQSYVRRDDYANAARWFQEAGNHSAAKLYEAFKGQRPYQIDAAGDSTIVPFLTTDPLPFVSVSIDGHEPVDFILDTGGAQVYVDREYAKSVGIEELATNTGSFAGGQTAETGQAKLASLGLGRLTVRQLPVTLLSLRRLKLNGRAVSGVLGTEFFSHFLTTIDYPNGRLILRSKRTHDRFVRAATEQGQESVRFWWQGTHYLVAWGRVNASGPQLWFMDTGLAGAGLTVAQSTVEAGGIRLREDQARTGAGGGGTGAFRAVPFVADSVWLGGVRERNVPGTFGPFPAGLEHAQGFRIAGIISHAFFRPYAVTFDFDDLRIYLKRAEASQ